MSSIHVQAFTRALADARNNARRARTEVQYLSANRKRINKVGKLLAPHLTREHDHMYMYMVAGDKSKIVVSMRQLESFKCLALENVLWLLNEIGTATGTSDWADSLNRDYDFEVDGIKVRVSAYVKSDSATCRKIVVGTETVTTPKYQIQCD